MSMQTNPGADSYIEAGGNNVKLVYILYLASFIIGLSGLIGLVFAYLNRGKGPTWVDSHYTFQIRTFWIGLLFSLLSMLLAIIGIGWLLMVLVGIWILVRCIKGLQKAARSEPIADPDTWLV